MAKPSLVQKKVRAEMKLLTNLGLTVFGLFLVVQALTFLGNHPGVGAIGLIVLGIPVFIWAASRENKRTKLSKHLELALEANQAGLVSAYRQSTHNDHFGNVVDGKWKQQIDIFLQTKVVSNLADFKNWRSSKLGRRFADRTEEFTKQIIDDAQSREPELRVDVLALAPREYEKFCGDVFRRLGWAIQETPATRDSGADFVAQKNGHRIVVQCKRYSRPVGNKAVQEVNAARQLYGGTVACVVAPTGYTSQARREAFGLGIYLLDHMTLRDFANQVEGLVD